MKMLVLEDEMSIRSFVTLNFKREGFDVLESDTGISAIKIFDENPDIQLAVLDVMLPDIDVFEV